MNDSEYYAKDGKYGIPYNIFDKLTDHLSPSNTTSRAAKYGSHPVNLTTTHPTHSYSHSEEEYQGLYRHRYSKQRDKQYRIRESKQEGSN